MIWRLMLRDKVLWTALPILAVLLGILTLAIPRAVLPAGEANAQAWVFLSVGWVVISLHWNVQARDSSFQAALPLGARQVWLAGVLSLLSLIWLPAIASVAYDFRSSRLLPAAAMLTVVMLARELRSLRLSRLRRWLGMLVTISLFVAILTLGEPWGEMRFPVTAPRIVVAVCALVSLVLFAFGFLNAPGFLRFDPVPASQDRPEQQTAEPRPRLWLTLWRSTWGTPIAAFLLLTGLVQGAAGFFGFTALVATGFMGATRSPGERWIAPLPVSQSKLFGWVALPPAFASAAGFALLRLHFLARVDLTAQAARTDFVIELTGIFLSMFLGLLAQSRWFSRVPETIRWIPYCAAFCCLMGFYIRSLVWPVPLPLPQYWLAHPAILAAPPLVSYWLARAAFAAREYRQSNVENRHIAPDSGLAGWTW